MELLKLQCFFCGSEYIIMLSNDRDMTKRHNFSTTMTTTS